MTKKKLKILRQLSVPQALAMAIAVVLRKTTKPFTSLYEIESVLDHVYANNYICKREGNGNLLSIADDPDINPYQFFLRRMTSDFAVFQQCLVTKQYRTLRDLVLQSVQKDQTKVRYIVDAGANIGCVTLYLARSFPEAQLISLEPDSGNYTSLEYNIKLNNLNSVTPLQKGLWGVDCTLAPSFDFRDAREWSFRFAPSRSNTGIPGISIPTLMRDFAMPGIDVLKIDIEGAEVILFDKDRTQIDWLNRVRYVAIEIHDSHARSNILDLLKEYGFAIVSTGEITIALRS